VQYAVLAYGHVSPAVTQWSDVVRILESLEAEDVMSSSHAEQLRAAYLEYRSVVHTAALADRAAVANKAQFAQHLASVTAIRNEWLPGII